MVRVCEGERESACDYESVCVGERKREKAGGRGLKDLDTATFQCVCVRVCV